MTIFFVAAAFQAISAAPPTILDVKIVQPCKRGSDEIVVCGRRGESPYRITQPAPEQVGGLPRAQMGLGEGTSLALEAEQVEIGGMPSKRAMVRLKIKF